MRSETFILTSKSSLDTIAMASTIRPSFPEWLGVQVERRAGDRKIWVKQWKEIWDEIRVDWFRQGFLRNKPPSEEQMVEMEAQLEGEVVIAGNKEKENNKRGWGKKGTKALQKAEVRLTLGGWAIDGPHLVAKVKNAIRKRRLPPVTNKIQARRR